MASIGVAAAAGSGAFVGVPYVGWAVGLAAAYIDQMYIYPALAGSPDEAIQPKLANLPISEQGPGAPRTFALGSRVRIPAHVMYQSSKAREEVHGGGKGGTDVTVKRVFVNALLHLNDRESGNMLQLIGNGQLLLWNERNIIGATSENMSAAVSASNVLVSFADQLDPDFGDTFIVGDLILAEDFVRVAGPTTWNGTYYEVAAITSQSASSGSTMTVTPIDGQSVASLNYTGGTIFSPASIKRVDDAMGGSALDITVGVWYYDPGATSVLWIACVPQLSAVAESFDVGELLLLRNVDWAVLGLGAGFPLGDRTCIVSQQVGGAVSIALGMDTSITPVGSEGMAIPAVAGKEIIVERLNPAFFTTTIFPASFNPVENYYAGHEDQGQPDMLVSDFGSGKTANYRGVTTQGLVECFVSAFGDQLPTNLEAIIEIDDKLSWAQAFEIVLQRGNLLNTQIDTTQIKPRLFRGAHMRGVSPVLQQIQPLLVAAQALVQDCNGVVRLFDVDTADSVQIDNGATFSDFGARMYGPQAEYDKVQSKDTPESQLPTSIGVRFQDPDSSFSIGYEHFGLRNPGGIDHVNEQQLSLSSLVLSRREARNLATTLMRRAWVNRRTYRMTLPCAYLHLLENDLITWTDDDSEVITARIIQRDIGANFLVKVTALREMASLEVAGSPVQSSAQVISQNVSTTTVLTVTAIDAPAISNSHTQTPGVRLAVADMGGTLQSATVWESQDGNSYQPVGTVGGTCALAYFTSTLSAQTASEVYGTTTVTLRAQTVDAYFAQTGSETLEACTQAQAEAGKNWCAIIDNATAEVEIAAFTTVSVSAGGIHTLGGWLRGLRGTPSGAHTPGATLLLLNQSTGGIFWREFTGPTPTTLAYKVVPSGGDIATTEAVTISSPPFRNVLPLPIRSVIRTYDSTALTTRFKVAAHWERQLLPLGTQPPHTMDEPFESYRINIYQHGSTDVIAATYLMDSRTTGASTLRDSYFDWSNIRAAAAGYTPGPSETYYISYQQVGEYGDGPLRFETI